MATNENKERRQVINKAWHLLNAFDYGWIKKKTLVPLESGTNAAGTLNYILVTTNQYLFDYKFNYDVTKGWSMQTILRETYKEAV